MSDGPYTFGQMQAQITASLWPFGLAVNLVQSTPAGNNPIRDIFVEAMLTCQKFVDCLQINNTQVVPQCNTLFKCGVTVTDAPRGHIVRLYTIDRVNQNTGLEDASVPTDWCSEVEYRQVGYDDFDKYVSQTLAGALDTGFWPWVWGFGLSGVVAFPAFWQTFWNSKLVYPPPSPNASTSPPLPLGYTYPQAATDNPSGRSQWGLWALKGGQIFVAPWIQSTETIIIEWNGLKRSYLDSDLVDNDPMLIQAVEAYVAKEYARKYDKDYDAEAANTARFNEALAILMDECRKENEKREIGSGTEARGASLIVPTFVNTAQTATASCPSGTIGNAVSYTVPAGFVVSTVSVADANAKAQSQALQLAGAQLSCTVVPPTYYNTPQSFTANCPAGSTGSAVTATIPAAQFSSIVSQDDANAQAIAAATTQAQSQLVCTFGNALYQLSGSCHDGSHPTTITIPAGTYTATSQAAADLLAQNDANNQLQVFVVANCGLNLFESTPQTVSVGSVCQVTVGTNSGTWTLAGIYTVPANTATGTTQLDANTTANLLAQNYGNQMLANVCTALHLSFTPSGIQTYVHNNGSGVGGGSYTVTQGNTQFGGNT